MLDLVRIEEEYAQGAGDKERIKGCFMVVSRIQ